MIRHVTKRAVCPLQIIAVALTFLPVVLLSFAEDAWAQFFYRGMVIRRYTLYGTIELDYEKRWSQGQGASSDVHSFTQNYELGVRGFIVDPRIAHFDVSGRWVDVSGTGDSDYTLKGITAMVTILDKLPPRLLTSWKYIPHPIMLRYTQYSGIQDYTNYGITLGYFMPEEVQRIRQEDQPGTPPFFPTVFFDYDHYKFDAEDYKTDADMYALRAFLTGRTYSYQLNFENFSQTGTVAYDRTFVQLQPNHFYYDEQTKRTFQVTNLLQYDKIDERKTTTIISRPNYTRPFGKDTLNITGNLNYVNVRAPAANTDAYATQVTADYTKVFSPRFTNTFSGAVGAFGAENEDSYFVQLRDSAYVDLSKVFRATGSTFVGVASNGPEYGLDLYLTTKTRVYAQVGYSFAILQPDPGKVVTHLVRADAAGPLTGTLSFSASAQYGFRDVTATGPLGSFTEDTYLLTGNLFWYFLQTSMSVGGSYSNVKTEREAERSNGESYTVQATLSRLVTKRTFLNVYSSWTRDATGVETLEFRPRLTWVRSLTFIDVDYDYRDVKNPGRPSITDNRLFVRFTRRFSRDFFFR